MDGHIGAPTITLTTFPTLVDAATVTIKGKVADKNGNPSLAINGEAITYNSLTGVFEKTLTLKEGNNTIELIATNKYGVSTTEKKTISFLAGTPSIEFSSCPEITEQGNAIISGIVTEQTRELSYISMIKKSI